MISLYDLRHLALSPFPSFLRLGRLLSLYRALHGLSVREFAKSLHISPQLLNFIETGRYPVTETVYNAAFALGINIAPKFELILSSIHGQPIAPVLNALYEAERLAYSEVLRFHFTGCLFRFFWYLKNRFNSDVISSRYDERGTRHYVFTHPALAWFLSPRITAADVLHRPQYLAASVPVRHDALTVSQVVDFLLFFCVRFGFDLELRRYFIETPVSSHAYTHSSETSFRLFVVLDPEK